MRHTRVLGSAAAVGLCLIVPALPASAQLPARPQPQLVSRPAAAAATELTGIVSDRGGRPLAGAVVSAIGSESAFRGVGSRGALHLPHRCPQGPYIVRAHLQGYLPARPRLVQISTSARGDFTITLVKRSEAADPPAVHRGRRRARGHAGGRARRGRDARARRAGVAPASSEAQRAQEPGRERPRARQAARRGLPVGGPGPRGRRIGPPGDVDPRGPAARRPVQPAHDHLVRPSAGVVLARRGAAAQHRVPVALGADAERRVAHARRDHAGRPVVVDRRRVVRARRCRRRTPIRPASRTACSATRAATPRRWRRCATAAARWACSTPTTLDGDAGRDASSSAAATPTTTTSRIRGCSARAPASP